MERFTTRVGGVDVRIVALLDVAICYLGYGSSSKTIIGYKTKVVRDIKHCDDVCKFSRHPHLLSMVSIPSPFPIH